MLCVRKKQCKLRQNNIKDLNHNANRYLSPLIFNHGFFKTLWCGVCDRCVFGLWCVCGVCLFSLCHTQNVYFTRVMSHKNQRFRVTDGFEFARAEILLSSTPMNHAQIYLSPSENKNYKHGLITI
jgi:hypothetical protein